MSPARHEFWDRESLTSTARVWWIQPKWHECRESDRHRREHPPTHSVPNLSWRRKTGCKGDPLRLTLCIVRSHRSKQTPSLQQRFAPAAGQREIFPFAFSPVSLALTATRLSEMSEPGKKAAFSRL